MASVSKLFPGQTDRMGTKFFRPIFFSDYPDPKTGNGSKKLPDRGKGVPSFDEMMDIALVEVDFDDPTTNVRGRRALAIAKPTPRGY